MASQKRKTVDKSKKSRDLRACDGDLKTSGTGGKERELSFGGTTLVRLEVTRGSGTVST